MLGKLQNLWNNHGFELLVILSISFIIIVGLGRKLFGHKGTWTTKQQYKYLAGLDNLYKKTIKQKKNSWFSSPVNDTDIHTQHQPQGKDSKGELECRRVLQYLFKRPFNKARPDFLRNPVTGGNFNLELDCFDPQLKIAVEYNGAQHYKYIPYFHRNKEAFLNQKYRDEMKRTMCRQNGVLLIEVPYTVKLRDIKSYLENEFAKYNIRY